MRGPSDNEQEPHGNAVPAASLNLFDCALAGGLWLVALCLYLATPITRGYGDGPNLVLLFSDPENVLPPYSHALYLPLARILGTVLAWFEVESAPAETLRLFSQLTAALGVGFSFLVARAFATSRLAAFVATALFAVSPPVWFYACTPEVHPPHYAAVGLVAVVTLFGPWKKPVLATVVMVALMPLLFLTHQTGLLLFPCWAILAGFARERVSSAFEKRTLWLRLAPAIAFSFALALLFNALLRDIQLVDSLTRSSKSVTHRTGPPLIGAWQGWLQPLALLWLPIFTSLLALARRRAQTRRVAVLLAVLAPSLVFYFFWGIPERGGYTLGGAVFLTALAAIGFDRWLQTRTGTPRPRALVIALAILLISLQGAYARYEVESFDDPSINAEIQERVAAARLAFGETDALKVLVSFDASNQTITAVAPDILEIRLLAALLRAGREGQTPAEFAADAVQLLREKGKGTVLVLDRSYASSLEVQGVEIAEVKILRAFQNLVSSSFEVTEFPGPGGGFWRLEPSARSSSR